MTRPCCPTCGKPLAKLTRTVWVIDRGWLDRRHRQLEHSTYSREVAPEAPLRSIADCRRHSNQQVVSVGYTNRPDRHVWRFSEWDGETYWTASKPFCNPDCTLAFARASYRAGYRLISKETEDVHQQDDPRVE
ncbi:MAG TPA: hypothetical protein VGF65_11175 [Mycobacterium sp.]|jgi:hypothetical protein